MHPTNTAQRDVADAWSDLPPIFGQIVMKLDATITAEKCLSLPREERVGMKMMLLAELNETKQEMSMAKELLEEIKENSENCRTSISELQVLCDNIEKLKCLLPAAPEKENVPAQSTTQMVSKKTDIPTISHLHKMELENVPSYIRLRTTLDQVNSFIDTFNKHLIQKYTLLKKKRSTLNRNETALWQTFKALETSDTKGCHFLVASDLKLAGKSERVILNMSAILRHCRRLREMRTGKFVRYVVVKG